MSSTLSSAPRGSRAAGRAALEAQQDPHLEHQRELVHGLGQEVVGAGLVTRTHGVRVRAGADQHHRQGGPRPLSDPGARLEAGEPGRIRPGTRDPPWSSRAGRAPPPRSRRRSRRSRSSQQRLQGMCDERLVIDHRTRAIPVPCGAIYHPVHPWPRGTRPKPLLLTACLLVSGACLLASRGTLRLTWTNDGSRRLPVAHAGSRFAAALGLAQPSPSSPAGGACRSHPRPARPRHACRRPAIYGAGERCGARAAGPAGRSR